MESYDALNAAISEVVREGRATFKDLVNFTRAADRAEFLFGRPVTEYLKETRTTIVNLRMAELAARSEDDTVRANAADREADHLLKITAFYETLTALVRPYLRAHQKAPPF